MTTLHQDEHGYIAVDKYHTYELRLKKPGFILRYSPIRSGDVDVRAVFVARVWLNAVFADGDFIVALNEFRMMHKSHRDLDERREEVKMIARQYYNCLTTGDRELRL